MSSSSGSHDVTRAAGFDLPLGDYETARCLSAIEAVSRTFKAVAEAGEVKCRSDEELKALERFLDECVRVSGDSRVQHYVIRITRDRYCYGFYVFPWVRNALDFIKSGGRPFGPDDRHWVQGLLFGYRPDAIQHYLTAESGKSGST